MAKKIKCADGITRTDREYAQWIRNLSKLAELEPNDLTREERKALEQEGWEF